MDKYRLSNGNIECAHNKGLKQTWQPVIKFAFANLPPERPRSLTRCYVLDLHAIRIASMTILLCIYAFAASACSCFEYSVDVAEDTRWEVNRSDLVAVGFAEVVQTAQLPYGESEAREGEGQIVSFTILKQWKGAPREEVRTRILTVSAMCGYTFVQGNSYLLYLYGPNDEEYFLTSICSRTKLFRDAEEEIGILDGLGT